jgi:hypothetical protein
VPWEQTNHFRYVFIYWHSVVEIWVALLALFYFCYRSSLLTSQGSDIKVSQPSSRQIYLPAQQSLLQIALEGHFDSWLSGWLKRWLRAESCLIRRMIGLLQGL